jgi:(p)ppGpp synthase/HD superfamily hydrolase
MSDIVNRALVFATSAHASVNHVRRYTCEPYIVHPIEVMMLVQTVAQKDEEMLAAALLHDVVEDTPIRDLDVRRDFGDQIANLVQELTEPVLDGNRATRKSAERKRLAAISSRGQTIKLADLISNTRTIVAHDPRFASIFFPELVALLKELTRGDAELMSIAWKLVPHELQQSPGFTD